MTAGPSDPAGIPQRTCTSCPCSSLCRTSTHGPFGSQDSLRQQQRARCLVSTPVCAGRPLPLHRTREQILGLRRLQRGSSLWQGSYSPRLTNPSRLSHPNRSRQDHQLTDTPRTASAVPAVGPWSAVGYDIRTVTRRNWIRLQVDGDCLRGHTCMCARMCIRPSSRPSDVTGVGGVRFSLMPITAPRTTLEPPMPPAIPRTRMIGSKPCPTTDMIVSRISSPGKAIQASTKRCTTRSSFPPK